VVSQVPKCEEPGAPICIVSNGFVWKMVDKR